MTGVVEGWTHFNVSLGVADTLTELSDKSGGASMDATTGFEVGTNYSFGLQRWVLSAGKIFEFRSVYTSTSNYSLNDFT